MYSLLALDSGMVMMLAVRRAVYGGVYHDLINSYFSAAYKTHSVYIPVFSVLHIDDRLRSHYSACQWLCS